MITTIEDYKNLTDEELNSQIDMLHEFFAYDRAVDQIDEVLEKKAQQMFDLKKEKISRLKLPIYEQQLKSLLKHD